MQIVAWVGLSQAAFASILVYFKKNKNIADKILFLWLVLLATDFLSLGLDYYIFTNPLLSSSFLLFNPALYLYIKALTVANFKLRKIYLLHLLPYIIIKVLSYFVQEPFAMNTFFNQDKYFIYRIFFAGVTTLSIVVYNVLSLVYVHRHRMKLLNEQSNIMENDNLGWVLFVSIFYVVYCILAFILAIVGYFVDFPPLSPHIFNYWVLLFLIYILSFYGLYQNTISQSLVDSEPIAKVPYQNSSMSLETKLQIKSQIEAYIVGTKAYLDSDLNMDKLAKQLNTPKHQLTEVLNSVMKQSFFQYVNSLRVEEVKKMLANKKNLYSIEAIGYECGFASKSSFYTVFKNYTGLTPTAYRNSLINE